MLSSILTWMNVNSSLEQEWKHKINPIVYVCMLKYNNWGSDRNAAILLIFYNSVKTVTFSVYCSNFSLTLSDVDLCCKGQVNGIILSKVMTRQAQVSVLWSTKWFKKMDTHLLTNVCITSIEMRIKMSI